MHLYAYSCSSPLLFREGLISYFWQTSKHHSDCFIARLTLMLFYRPGSVLAEFTLIFATALYTKDHVITQLQGTLRDGKLGNLTVDPNSLKVIQKEGKPNFDVSGIFIKGVSFPLDHDHIVFLFFPFIKAFNETFYGTVSHSFPTHESVIPGSINVHLSELHGPWAWHVTRNSPYFTSALVSQEPVFVFTFQLINQVLNPAGFGCLQWSVELYLSSSRLL